MLWVLINLEKLAISRPTAKESVKIPVINSQYKVRNPSGHWMTAVVRVGTPEPDPISNNADYRCKVEIPELSLCEYAYGIDALQSLCLIPQCLKYLIEPLISEGWTFYSPQDTEHELDLASICAPPESIRPRER